MIQLLNITSSYRETARITFEILSTVVIDKACDEWNFVINSDRFYKKELLKQVILDKRDEFVNQDTKDDELDENKCRIGDSLPYTLTVERTSSKLHDSSKTLPRSLSISFCKRKSR